MPEFQLDLGTQQSAAAFNALDAFTRGYLEAAFFTETNDLYGSDDWDSAQAQEDIAEGRCSGAIPSDSSIDDGRPHHVAGFVALASHHHNHHGVTMSTQAILALVVVLNTTSGAPETTVAQLPSDQCLAAMRELWQIPAETVDVGGFPMPALDAYCVDVAQAPAMPVAFLE